MTSDDPNCDWSWPEMDECVSSEASQTFGSCISGVYANPPQALTDCLAEAYPADDDPCAGLTIDAEINACLDSHLVVSEPVTGGPGIDPSTGPTDEQLLAQTNLPESAWRIMNKCVRQCSPTSSFDSIDWACYNDCVEIEMILDKCDEVW